MPIKRILLLVLISTQLYATNLSWPRWDMPIFWHHYWIGQEDNQLDSEYLSLQLEGCLQDFPDVASCEFAIIHLMMLARINDTKAIEYANGFLNVLPEESDSELYYIRDYAIRALARAGQPNILIEEVGNSPSYEDAFVMAETLDYRWADGVIEGLNTDDFYQFCDATKYVSPFISENNPDKNQFINPLVSSLNSSSINKIQCAVLTLINEEIPSEINENIKSVIHDLVFSNDQQKHKLVNFLIERWPLNVESDEEIIHEIIKSAATSTNLDTRHYMNSLAVNLGLIYSTFPLEDAQLQEFNGEIINMGSDGPLIEKYLTNHAYDDIWEIYANQLTFTDIKSLINEFQKGLNQIINLQEKVERLRNHPLLLDNTYLNFQLTEVAVKAQLPVASQLLMNLFNSASNLQKNTLIARFPDALASQSVLPINSINQWVRLANLTNLLAICEIDIPPIESELSNPIKLAEYLENNTALLEKCSRVAGKY